MSDGTPKDGITIIWKFQVWCGPDAKIIEVPQWGDRIDLRGDVIASPDDLAAAVGVIGDDFAKALMRALDAAKPSEDKK